MALLSFAGESVIGVDISLHAFKVRGPTRPTRGAVEQKAMAESFFGGCFVQDVQFFVKKQCKAPGNPE